MQSFRSEIIHHGGQAARAGFAASDQGEQVAFIGNGLSRIRANDFKKQLVRNSFRRHLAWRDQQALVEHVASLRPHSEPAEVHQVRSA